MHNRPPAHPNKSPRPLNNHVKAILARDDAVAVRAWLGSKPQPDQRQHAINQAARVGAVASLPLLLTALPNTKNGAALVNAAEGGHQDCFMLCLRGALDQDTAERAGQSAAEGGYVDCLTAIITAGPATADYGPALSAAARGRMPQSGVSDHMACVRLLLNHVDPLYINAAASTAVGRGNEECLKVLLPLMTASPTCDSRSGLLELAIRRCHVGCVALLVEHRPPTQNEATLGIREAIHSKNTALAHLLWPWTTMDHVWEDALLRSDWKAINALAPEASPEHRTAAVAAWRAWDHANPNAFFEPDILLQMHASDVERALLLDVCQEGVPMDSVRRM